jgi:hypothetical protein
MLTTLCHDAIHVKRVERGEEKKSEWRGSRAAETHNSWHARAKVRQDKNTP